MKTIHKFLNFTRCYSCNKYSFCFGKPKQNENQKLTKKEQKQLLFPFYTIKENNINEYYVNLQCKLIKELIDELIKSKSKIKFRKYCKSCEHQCCIHDSEDEGPFLIKSEREKLIKKGYENCINSEGYIKMVDSTKTSPCVFFNITKLSCILKHKDRPLECLLYPFNFIYTLKDNRKKNIYELDMNCLIAQQIVKELVNRK